MNKFVKSSKVSICIALVLVSLSFAQDQTYNFNGTSQYASVSYNSALNPSTFTIEAWALVTGGAGNYRAVVSSRGNYIGYILYAGADNNWQFWIGNGSAWTTVSGPAVTLNKWTHLAGVYSGGTMTFYVDGVSAGSASVTLSANTTGPFNIGAVDDNGSSPQLYLPGDVDEVRLWNTARSAAQIRANLFKDLSETESGLVADYKMDVTGTTLTNSCTNFGGLDGTTHNNPPQYSSSIAYEQNTLSFDGGNDYVQVGTNPAGSGHFSVEAWAKVTGGSDYRGVISSSNASNQGFLIYAANNNTWQFWVGSGSSWQILTGPAITLNQWTHVAGTFDGSTAKFYVNGIQVATQAVSYSANTSILRIGASDNAGNAAYYFHGDIDEVKIWNTAITISQIINSMHPYFDPTTATNLAAYYSVNQGLNAGSNGNLKTLYDLAGGHNGTLNNFALTGSTSNFISSEVRQIITGAFLNANLWLKADVGAANSGGNLTSWTDQTGINTFTKFGTIGYQANAVNFNPAVAISSSHLSNIPPDNRLEGNTNIGVADAFAVYIEDVQNQSGSLVGNSDGTYSGFMKGVFLGRDDQFYSQTDGSSGLASVVSSKIGVSYKLVNVDLSPATTPFWKLAQNGVELNPSAGTLTSFSSISIEPSIGGSVNPGDATVRTFRHFRGKVAEILLYPLGLNATEKSKVESYLAIKYGISLGDNTNAVAYLSSSGATIWSSDNTYKYDVFGIGKDDDNGLNQTSSNSINTGSGDGTGQSGKGNIVLSNPSSLADGDFFLMGHDNGALTQQTTEVPVAGQRRIAREWLVKRTNDPGTLDLSFDILGLTLMGTTATDFKLLIDANGDFSSGATVVDAANLTGTKVSFTGLTIPDGSYLTIITGFLQPVGPGVLGANLWVKANEGATNSGNNLTGWTDQTGLNIFTVSGNPQTGISKINFNNAIDFDGSGDWLTGNTAITFQTLYAVIKRNTTGNEGTVISVSGHSGATNPGNVGYMIRGERMWTGNNLALPNTVYIQSAGNLGTGKARLGIVEIVPQTGISGNVVTHSKSFIDGESFSMSKFSGDGSTMGVYSFTPYIGRAQDAPSEFNGQIAEVIMYDDSHSSTQRNQIQSYLAIKYGITLNQSITNYVSSSGTVLWNNTTYWNDVFGIGKDDLSGLNQTQSNSINSGSGDGTGQSGKGNIVLSSASSLESGDFMMMGHDNAALTYSGAELPGSMSDYYRTAREWYVDKTGDVGTVTLTFDMTGIPGITVGGAAADYAILLDTDADFSNATKVDAISLNGNVITFNTLALTDGQYITFAGKISALPVELTSFTGTYASGKVVLNWETATEISNYGFEVERSDVSGQWQKIGFVPGSGNSNSPKTYSYEDKSFISGKLQYRLKQVDTDGAFAYSPVVEVNADIPATYELRGNYPNPFNPSTRIAFGIPERGAVKLTVFNALGETVAELVNGILEAGRHTAEFNAAGLPSGIYFYRLEAGKFVQTNKMLLLK